MKKFNYGKNYQQLPLDGALKHATHKVNQFLHSYESTGRKDYKIKAQVWQGEMEYLQWLKRVL